MTLSPTPHNENEPDKSAAIVNSNPNDDKPNLQGDWSNFFLLLLLYGMQGVPLGLCLAVPILLQSKKNVTYQEQVRFYSTFTSSCPRVQVRFTYLSLSTLYYKIVIYFCRVLFSRLF